MIKAGMTIAEAIAQLTRGFIKMMGRNPDGLEKIKIQQEAVKKIEELNKVVDMQGNVIDTSKGIMGGQQIGQKGMFDNIFNRMNRQMGNKPKVIDENTGEGFIDFVRTRDPEAAAKLQKTEDEIKAAIEEGNKRYLNKIKKQKKEGTYKRYNPPEGSQLDLQIKTEYEKAIRGKSKLMKGKFKGTEEDFRDMIDEMTDDFASGGRVGLKEGKGIMQMASDPDPMDERNMVMESLSEKYYGKPLKDLTEDEFIDLEEALEDLTGKKYRGAPSITLAEGGRIGYKLGSLDKARRAFLKTAAGIGGGIAALKTGLLGFGKQAPEAAKKVAENFSTTLSEAPNYFFDLVSKIKMFGKKSKVGPLERVDEYSYIGKNGDQYTLTEDLTTGDAQIIKDKMGVGSYGDKTFDTINDRTVMEYKAPKQDVDVESRKGTREAAEYEEYKVEFDSDGTEAGADAVDEIVQKEIIEEATEKVPSIKKAGGGLAYMLGE